MKKLGIFVSILWIGAAIYIAALLSRDIWIVLRLVDVLFYSVVFSIPAIIYLYFQRKGKSFGAEKKAAIIGPLVLIFIIFLAIVATAAIGVYLDRISI